MKIDNSQLNYILNIERLEKYRGWTPDDIGRIFYCEQDDTFYFGTRTEWISLQPNDKKLTSFGPTGGTGGIGGLGDRGYIGQTGMTGGTGGTGGTGYYGITGGTGGRGKNARTGGTGGTGGTGRKGLQGGQNVLVGDGEYGTEFCSFEVTLIGTGTDAIFIEIKNIYNSFSCDLMKILPGEEFNFIYLSSDQIEIGVNYKKFYPKSVRFVLSTITYNDTNIDYKLYNFENNLIFRLFHSLDGTFKKFKFEKDKKIIFQIVYGISCTIGSKQLLTVLAIGPDDNIQITSTPLGIDYKHNIYENYFEYKTTVQLLVTLSQSFYCVKNAFGVDDLKGNIASVKIKCEDAIVCFKIGYVKFKLVVIIDGEGRVFSDIFTEIDCKNTCVYEYEYGTQIDLIAEPISSRYEFISWRGNDIYKQLGNNCIVKISGDTSVTALFKIKKFSLTITIYPTSNSGFVKSKDNKISCPSICTNSFEYGTKIELIATENNSTFLYYLDEKSGVKIYNKEYDFEIHDNTVISVFFKDYSKLTVSTNKPDSVKFAVNDVTDINSFVGKFKEGTPIKLKVTKFDTYLCFIGWRDISASKEEYLTTELEYLFNMPDKDIDIIAIFDTYKNVDFSVQLFHSKNFSISGDLSFTSNISEFNGIFSSESEIKHASIPSNANIWITATLNKSAVCYYSVDSIDYSAYPSLNLSVNIVYNSNIIFNIVFDTSIEFQFYYTLIAFPLMSPQELKQHVEVYRKLYNSETFNKINARPVQGGHYYPEKISYGDTFRIVFNNLSNIILFFTKLSIGGTHIVCNGPADGILRNIDGDESNLFCSLTDNTQKIELYIPFPNELSSNNFECISRASTDGVRFFTKFKKTITEMTVIENYYYSYLVYWSIYFAHYYHHSVVDYSQYPTRELDQYIGKLVYSSYEPYISHVIFVIDNIKKEINNEYYRYLKVTFSNVNQSINTFWSIYNKPPYYLFINPGSQQYDYGIEYNPSPIYTFPCTNNVVYIDKEKLIGEYFIAVFASDENSSTYSGRLKFNNILYIEDVKEKS